MRSTVIDADGNVACPNCGAKNNFTSKRSGKAKVLGVATIGVGAVAMPKRLQCQGCGKYLKTQGSTSLPGLSHVPLLESGDDYAVELRVIGRKKIAVIKALRDARPMGLKDAMELVDCATHGPTVLVRLPKDNAEAFAARLISVGASAVVVPPLQRSLEPARDIAEQPVSADIPAQIAKLAELHTAGILTNEEFTAKKTELLGRM